MKATKPKTMKTTKKPAMEATMKTTKKPARKARKKLAESKKNKFVSMLPPGSQPSPGCEALEDEPTSGGGGHGPDGGKGPDSGHGGDGGHGRDGRPGKLLAFKRVKLPTNNNLCFFTMVRACKFWATCGNGDGSSRPGEGQPF